MAFQFPDDLLFGTATSSHQVEGTQKNNDWWAAAQRGEIQPAGTAADWWNRAEEDFDRMQAMGQTTHRLSLEWSRIQPEPDRWDDDAITRYREMIIGLRQRGIEPMVTLHHFTNPLWLTQQGGWESPDSPAHFERYVRKIVEALGERVTLWCTINEPMVLVGQGYALGIWPPFQQDFGAAEAAATHLLRAHARAYHTIHTHQPEAQVGIAKHIVRWQPYRGWFPLDRLARNLTNRITNHAFLEGVSTGYIKLPFKRPIHIPHAANTLDWLGINYYQRYRVGVQLLKVLKRLTPMDAFYQGTQPGQQKGPGGWGEIYPEGLYHTLKEMTPYGVPFYITENGIPDQTDVNRPRFILEHLYYVWRAMQEGLNVKGYFHWSMVDNFEWAEAYNPEFRFGLFEINHETQERTPKPSAHLYEAICKQQAITAEMVSQYAPESFLLKELHQAEAT